MLTETILIVEDEEAIRDSLVALLELHNYQTLVSINGAQGLELAKQHIPDLIISDVIMPQMSGFELLSELRNNTETELIPIIMLTAKADLESKLQGLELGADDYITKPFEFKELHLKIINLLRRREKMLERIALGLKGNSTVSTNNIFLKQLDLILNEQLENTGLLTENIAYQLNISHSTFSRRLKKLTGKNPNQYTREFRLNKAREMIWMNYGNVSEIAYKTGFGSLSYFSTQYKNYFGNNPSDDYSS